jgi:hypothetical protein
MKMAGSVAATVAASGVSGFRVVVDRAEALITYVEPPLTTVFGTPVMNPYHTGYIFPPDLIPNMANDPILIASTLTAAAATGAGVVMYKKLEFVEEKMRALRGFLMKQRSLESRNQRPS